MSPAAHTSSNLIISKALTRSMSAEALDSPLATAASAISKARAPDAGFPTRIVGKGESEPAVDVMQPTEPPLNCHRHMDEFAVGPPWTRADAEDDGEEKEEEEAVEVVEVSAAAAPPT